MHKQKVFLMTQYEFSTRVYYEDTDAMGIVYYANYLRFFERARTECLREGGFEKSGSGLLGDDKKIAFVVRRCDIRFVKPAYHDDWLRITTNIVNDEKARILRKKTGVIDMLQRIYHEKELLVRLRVHLVTIDQEGQLIALPQQILDYFDLT